MRWPSWSGSWPSGVQLADVLLGNPDGDPRPFRQGHGVRPVQGVQQQELGLGKRALASCRKGEQPSAVEGGDHAGESIHRLHDLASTQSQ